MRLSATNKHLYPESRCSNDNPILKVLYQKYFKDCKRVLDVGCGIGNFIAMNPNRIFGVDACPDAVNICKRRGFKAELMNAERLLFKDEVFDGVNCRSVLEHVFDARKMLLECYRVLKPGGILVVVTPDIQRWKWDFYIEGHVTPMSKRNLEALAVTAGFKEINVRNDVREELIPYLSKWGFSMKKILWLQKRFPLKNNNLILEARK